MSLEIAIPFARVWGWRIILNETVRGQRDCPTRVFTSPYQLRSLESARFFCGPAGIYLRIEVGEFVRGIINNRPASHGAVLFGLAKPVG
jgi:hypothetical protein